MNPKGKVDKMAYLSHKIQDSITCCEDTAATLTDMMEDLSLFNLVAIDSGKAITMINDIATICECLTKAMDTLVEFRDEEI